MNGTNFSLYEQMEYKNNPLTITYTPNSSTYKYTYDVYKDQEIISNATVTNRKPVDIELNDSGIYQIIVTAYDKWDRTTIHESGMYKLDFESPHIISTPIIKLEQLEDGKKASLDLFKSQIRVEDNIDKDLMGNVTCNFDEYDFSKTGVYNVTCTVSDNAGNEVFQDINFNVVKSTRVQYQVTAGIIFLILVIIVFLLGKYKKAISFERRISRYSIDPLKNKHGNLFDKFNKIYEGLIDKIAVVLEKSEIIKRHSKRYEKYAKVTSLEDGIHIVSSKFILAIVCCLISIFAKTIQFKVMDLFELLIPFICGYFLLDIMYLIKYKIYKSKLENDLLQAIIIMNNAFKSGRSISQAIELVTVELDGPMAEEFKMMSLELSFGLSIDTVFKRFGDRVKIDEINYLTSSLSILNKTGGNIIKVFSSIEKTLFNKKKLRLELSSLTGSSKVIVYALFAIPILFVVFINILSPSYFEPLFTTFIGKILLVIMIVIYLVYIFFVRKIMKVRM